MKLSIILKWNSIEADENNIISELYRDFYIIKNVSVLWSADSYHKNLYRLFGTKFFDLFNKAGIDKFRRFSLILYRQNPNSQVDLFNTKLIETYEKHNSWAWLKCGNPNEYLYWTSDCQRVNYLLTMIFGMNSNDFISNINCIPSIWRKDLIGSYSWDGFKQFFYVLNNTCNYVMLRNFENYPDSFHYGKHADIDILCDDYEKIVRITNANSVFKDKYRVQCMCMICNENTQFDFRYLGDGYYDFKWERDILRKRKLYGDIYIPDKKNYAYMILYHALVHKKKIAIDYKTRLDLLFNKSWNKRRLYKFLNNKEYNFSEPTDLSVYYNPRVIRGHISFKRRKMILKQFLKDLISKVFNINK